MSIKDRLRSWLSRKPQGPSSRPRPPVAETRSPPGLNHKISEVTDRRRQILKAYARCLDDHRSLSGNIRDISELPFSKDETLDAIATEILETEDQQRVEALKGAARFLADFQHDVGPAPLTLMGISDQDMLTAARNGSEFVDPLAVIKRNPDREKYKSLKEIAEKELVSIMARLSELDQRRHRAPQRLAH